MQDGPDLTGLLFRRWQSDVMTLQRLLVANTSGPKRNTANPGTFSLTRAGVASPLGRDNRDLSGVWRDPTIDPSRRNAREVERIC